MREELTLNVGCGCDLWGKIRLDTERFSSRYDRRTSVNIIGDVHFLPFQDNVFKIVKCFHVLEHVHNPHRAFRELRRVASQKVIVRVPIWHLYSFLIEAIALFVYLFCKPTLVLHQLRKIVNWRERYSGHKWYIRFKQAKVNKQFGIPKEFEREYSNIALCR